MKARIYTKTGDKGQTSLVGGARVSKTNARLVAYGTLDELNSSLGMVRCHLDEKTADFERRLENVQNNLFNIGSHLACEDEKILPSLPGLGGDALSRLEIDMDKWEDELPPLKQFILPGGVPAAAAAHVARTICRRAEREVLRLREAGIAIDDDQLIFLNRLSDWLFLLARKCNHLHNRRDIPWTKT